MSISKSPINQSHPNSKQLYLLTALVSRGYMVIQNHFLDDIVSSEKIDSLQIVSNSFSLL